MRKLSRKLVIACLAVAFAVIALGTSTYAWLVVSKTASVEQFSANVKAGDGSLLISLDKDNDISWKTSLSAADIKGVIGSNFTFEDVTYKNNDGFYEIEISSNKAELSDSKIEESKLLNSGVVQFTFYAKIEKGTSDTDQTLYLDLTNYADMLTSNNASTSWAPAYSVADSSKSDYSLVVGQTNSNYKACNAARIMIETSTKEYIFENDVNTGLQKSTESVGAMGYLKQALGTGCTVEDNDAEYTTTVLNSAQALELGTLSKDGTALAITVTIWLEGYDYDCLNALYSQPIDVSLALKLNN